MIGVVSVCQNTINPLLSQLTVWGFCFVNIFFSYFFNLSPMSPMSLGICDTI